jgi:4-amino-4-deoxy-L-arabinose transferase-like glycosyltransferase
MMGGRLARIWIGLTATMSFVERSPHFLWCCALLLVVVFLFVVGAPTGGAFSYPDAPRHALNGAFVMDFIAAAPIDAPTQYAYDYYSKYPALTILFYPPLFYVTLAPFYALLGVSQETALAVELLFYVVLVTGTYFLAARWVAPATAFAAALILGAAPEVAFWGRQVMLEIPAFAVLVWSAFFFVKHLQEQRALELYAAIGLLVVAMYLKQTVAFMALPYAAVLLYHRGWALFRDKHSYIIAGLALIGLMPLLVLTLEFGLFNAQSLVKTADTATPRSVLENWTYYARVLPEQMGWPALLAAFAFVGFTAWRRRGDKALDHGLLFLAVWFLIGYAFFSAIEHKEPRFDIFVLAPIALAAAFMWDRIPSGFAQRSAPIAAITLGVATLFLTLSTRPVLYVEGYRNAVDYIAHAAPKQSNVLFSGYRDGAFIFNMRALANRPDLSVIRADKLLLKLAVYRELGVEQKSYSEAEIAGLINALGVHYVVAQPDFWTDLEQMARLQAVLKSAQFKEVARFKTPANYDSQEKELVVYRNLGPVAKGPIAITNEVPFIDRVITGTPGAK